MELLPVSGIVLRHIRLFLRDFNMLSATLYWPLLDVIIWGFLGTWLQKAQNMHQFAAVSLLGILLMQSTFRALNPIGFCLLEEIWSNNLVNLFSLPLRLWQWIAGTIIFAALVTLFVAFCSILIIWGMYDLSLTKIVKCFLLFSPPLFVSGIWLGFTALQLIISFGKRAQEFGFILGWFFAPFSGAFYPIEALPAWGRAISAFLPMSYLLEGMRNYVLTDTNPLFALLKGYTLALLYATIAITLFVYAFNKSKIKGLKRLSD